jgi:hypothetical protein
MGMINELIRGNETLLADPRLRDVHEKFKQGGPNGFEALRSLGGFLDADNPLLNPELSREIWERYVDTADRYNQPGRFTAVIGYEWTPTQSGDKLHRNVLYRGDAAQARRLLPFTAAESVDPQDLWKWMQRYEELTGSAVLALAHNGNLSNGQMFPVETNPNTGAAIDAGYVETRSRWEPLYEVTQIKGDGETHPKLSPEDEFADFETWDRGNVSLEILERQLGTNPYRFGMVGSTDSHTALATAAEDNFFGKATSTEPSATRMAEPMIAFDTENPWMNWETSASGYAAVWATENTREAIFDAMKRREVYATSGSRMTVRFFGGFDFEAGDAGPRELVRRGYESGVPMGGVLEGSSGKKTPSFLVAALKDTHSGNLDRIQIVKGWLDGAGATHEKVYEVVWSDAHRRAPGRNGTLPPVGNTVDVANAGWTDTIGDAQLSGFWRDPDFDPSQPSFYYVRVLEIPTPRWTAYEAKRFGVEIPEGAEATIQERAYTSPIWYMP